MNAYVGTPTSRVDGRAKVTGAAKYAGEFPADKLLHGFVVEATIPCGRVARLDTSAALQVEGVLDVLTHAQPSAAGRQGRGVEGRGGARGRLAFPSAL